MMFNIVTVLLHSRALRAHCEGEPDKINALVSVREVARGMGIRVERVGAACWIGAAELARGLEASARTLSRTRDGSFDQAGAIVGLSLRFNALANHLGFRVEPIDDDAARGESEAEKPASHASKSPGPVNCQQRLRHQGKAYPRSCERCGLGPCPFFDKDGNSLLRTSERSAAE